MALAIKADVFKNYRYRYDFAEDLDLGIRLLKEGHKIALLGSTYIIHGHNRDEEYYFKRWYCEKKALDKILDEHTQSKDLYQIANPVISLVYVTRQITDRIRNTKDQYSSLDDFCVDILKAFDKSKMMLNASDCIILDEYSKCELLSWCLEQMQGLTFQDIPDYQLINNLKYFFVDGIMQYFREKKVSDCKLLKEITSLVLIKETAGIIGAEMARLDENSEVAQRFSKEVRGI